MIVCPNLGIHFPRGNNHKGSHITQESAASLPMSGRNQVPSLVYDESKNGFCPREWRFHVNQNEDQSLFLQPLDQDGDGDDYSNMVHVHRSRNEEDNFFFIDQHLILSMNAMQ